MVTKAIMSDYKNVIIVAPNTQILFFIKTLFKKLAPKPKRMADQYTFLIGDKKYYLRTPYRHIANQFRGMTSVDLYHDHTMFEFGYIGMDQRTGMIELTELVRLRQELEKEVKDEGP